MIEIVSVKPPGRFVAFRDIVGPTVTNTMQKSLRMRKLGKQFYIPQPSLPNSLQWHSTYHKSIVDLTVTR